MAVLEIYLEILTNFFEILHPPLDIRFGITELIGLLQDLTLQHLL